MIDPMLGLAAAMAIIGVVFFAISFAFPRSGQRHLELWGISAACLLFAVCLFTGSAVSSWSQGPPAPRGSLNPGGPSGNVLLALAYVTGVTVGLPSAYLGIGLVGVFPPQKLSPSVRSRITVAFLFLAVAAAIATGFLMVSNAKERKESKPQPVMQEPFDRFEQYRNL